MKRHASLFVVIMLCVAVMAGCGSGEQVSLPISASSAPLESETSASVSSPDSSSEPPSSSEQPAVPSEPEPVKKSINFAEMDKEELIEVLQPVLDKAWTLCEYGYCDLYADHTKANVGDYYPVRDMPYTIKQELERDMLTVFTQEILDTQFKYMLKSDMQGGFRDYNSQLYASSNSGYSKGRKWNAETIDVLDATPDTLTASMEVQFREYTFTAPISFKYLDGNIIMGEDFFANPESDS